MTTTTRAGTTTTKIRKAVIPAAGLGTRFLPVTKAQPKEMIPVVDKPAIQYNVEEAVRAGLDDILIITGRGKRAIEDHFDRAFELEAELDAKGKHDELEGVVALAELATIHYVRQGEPKGLGHAVSVARQHVGHEPFAVLLGDDIMYAHSTVLADMLTAHERHGGSVVALRRVPREDIGRYGCAVAEPVEGRTVRVTDLVEKPDPADAPSDLAVFGRYVLTPDVFDCLEHVEPGKNGEIQLTDALVMLMEQARLFGIVFEHEGFDIGNKLDYLKATVELALERDDLGPALRPFLRGLLD